MGFELLAYSTNEVHSGNNWKMFQETSKRIQAVMRSVSETVNETQNPNQISAVATAIEALNEGKMTFYVTEEDLDSRYIQYGFYHAVNQKGDLITNTTIPLVAVPLNFGEWFGPEDSQDLIAQLPDVDNSSEAINDRLVSPMTDILIRLGTYLQGDMQLKCIDKQDMLRNALKQDFVGFEPEEFEGETLDWQISFPKTKSISQIDADGTPTPLAAIE